MLVEFYVSTNYVRCAYKEIVEFEDNATDEEIDETFNDWVNEHCDRGWCKVEDDS